MDSISQSKTANYKKTTDEHQLTMGSDLPSLVAKPFHFLIQEQAKCMIAIKDLQDQVQSLCHFRKVVAKSFPEVVGVGRNMQYRPVHGEAPWPKSYSNSAGRLLPTVTDGTRKTTASLHHSSSSAESVDLDGGSIKSKNKTRPASSQKFVIVAQGKNWLRIRPYTANDSELDDSDEPMSTSDSLCSDSLRATRRKSAGGGRQDSGFSTEPNADKSLAPSWMGLQSKDELFSLLDLIETQSLELKNELDQLQVRANCVQDETSEQSSNSNKTIECLRKERDQLAERLLVSEERSLTAHVRANQLEERLRTAATEREQLDTRIHGMHLQFIRPNGSVGRDSLEVVGGNADSSSSTSLPDALLRGKVHVKPNPARLAAVLKETRLLELQRQLLISVVENEVLKTQLEHVSRDWSRRTREWQRELESAHNEARASKTALDRARLDLQSERARLRMLQRALQTAPALDGTSSLNTHLVHSLQALGQSVADHYKDKATNTENQVRKREMIKIETEGLNGHTQVNSSKEDDITPSSSPASMTSPQPPRDQCKEKWRSTPNLIELSEDNEGLVNGVKNGVAKPTDPAIQQRIQNFLQRISEHLKPMETLSDDKDYLETIL